MKYLRHHVIVQKTSEIGSKRSNVTVTRNKKMWKSFFAHRPKPRLYHTIAIRSTTNAQSKVACNAGGVMFVAVQKFTKKTSILFGCSWLSNAVDALVKLMPDWLPSHRISRSVDWAQNVMPKNVEYEVQLWECVRPVAIRPSTSPADNVVKAFGLLYDLLS